MGEDYKCVQCESLTTLVKRVYLQSKQIYWVSFLVKVRGLTQFDLQTTCNKSSKQCFKKKFGIFVLHKSPRRSSPASAMEKAASSSPCACARQRRTVFIWVETISPFWRYRMNLHLGGIMPVRMNPTHLHPNQTLPNLGPTHLDRQGPSIQTHSKWTQTLPWRGSTVLTGCWRGQLALVDGHNWLFPVACGVFESESAECWKQFFKKLQSAIGSPTCLVFSNDAGKGIDHVVTSVFFQWS